MVRTVLRLRGRLAALRRALAPPSAVVLEGALALADTAAMRAVAGLGIPDRLDDGPKPAAVLAEDCGVEPAALDRLLRFAVSRGLLATTRRGEYRNNRIARALRTDDPASMRDLALFAGAPTHLELWSQLEASIRTGQSAAAVGFGKPVFEVFADQPTFGAHFNGGMEALSRVQAPAVLSAHDFSTATSVCDVGGGTGTLLAEILHAHPHLDGTLLDLEEVVADAGTVLEGYSVADRVEAVGGDFFVAVPAGADRYVLQSIIHDWDDDAAVEILRNVRAAMGPTSRLLVVEMDLPTAAADHPGETLDLEMLVVTEGGRERTRAEHEALFARADLRIERTTGRPPHAIFELSAA